MKATLIDPQLYRRTPWKNGGGTTIDIAGASRDGVTGDDWDSMIWRFGRTSISAPGAFSDLTGFHRMQVVVSGSGLALRTPFSEIDVRRPFQPVRFDGGTPIVSDLEAGPVDVVNLMGDSRMTNIDLHAPQKNALMEVPAGIHILYAPNGLCSFTLDGAVHAIESGWSLRLDAAAPAYLLALSGGLIVGSVYLRT